MKKAVFMILFALIFVLTGCAGGLSAEPNKSTPENADSTPERTESMPESAENKSGAPAETDPAHVTLPQPGPYKQYKWEKPGFGGDFIITLYDEGRYTYYVGFLSSYIGMGTWTCENGRVVLTEDKELCGYDNVFRFSPSADNATLFYIAEESSKFMYVDVQDKDAFHLMNAIPWDEARYTPDYNSTSTLHADTFLENLKKDGYHQDGEIRKDYAVENIKGVFNITPAGISEEDPDLEIFLVKDGYHCFMTYKGEIYRYDTFGGYHHRLVLWDYDGNGVKDLVSYHSSGSGVSYLSVDVTDLATMQTLPVLSRGILWEPGFSFAFDGEYVYLDGEKLTYSDGAFHCKTELLSSKNVVNVLPLPEVDHI